MTLRQRGLLTIAFVAVVAFTVGLDQTDRLDASIVTGVVSLAIGVYVAHVGHRMADADVVLAARVVWTGVLLSVGGASFVAQVVFGAETIWITRVALWGGWISVALVMRKVAAEAMALHEILVGKAEL